MPKISKKTQKVTIISNKEVCSAHFVMNLKASFLAKHSIPGQFVNVKVEENVTDPLLRIPLGVHKITENGISLLYKVVGEGTKILSNKKKGDEVDILGPLGKGFDVEQDTEAILVAGGHGIAPLYALAEQLAKKKIKTTFFIGVRSQDHLVCVDELKSLGVEGYIATEDGSVGVKGYVTELLANYIKGDMGNYSGSKLKKKNLGATIYACGPRPMLAALSAVAEENDVPAQTSLDAYMACGIGACLGCAIKTKDGYKMVCKDGPVFDSKEIEWI